MPFLNTIQSVKCTKVKSDLKLLYGEKWQFEIELYFIRSEAVLKSEIRISKHETISNDRNLNEINGKRECHTAFVLNFNHLDFDIVSDFGC